MLRNRQDVEERKLVGVNRVADPTKLKLGTFSELANWIQAKRYKIKKKRGPVLLSGDEDITIPTGCIETSCTDATERGQASISIEDRFDNFNSHPGSVNLKASWGYISSFEEVFVLVVPVDISGGAYSDGVAQINHFETPAVLSHPPLIVPDGGGASGASVGTSDENIYVRKLNEHMHSYYPDTNVHIDSILDQSTPDNLLWTSSENIFTKRGDRIYSVAHAQPDPDHFTHLLSFDTLVAGTQVDDFDLGEELTVQQIVATDLHIFMLCTVIGAGDVFQIRKYARSDGSLVDTFLLDGLNPAMLAVVNDDLIYVLTAPSGLDVGVYYIVNFANLVYVGHTPSTGFSGLGKLTGMFTNDSFYYGHDGVSGFSTDIFKITIACPDGDPVVASVTRASATVAAGDDIEVSWADILLPEVTDTIQLRPEPAPGMIGFAGSATAFQSTDGNSEGTITFTIPGGTPPGSYVFMFTPTNSVYVATSAPFTVT